MYDAIIVISAIVSLVTLIVFFVMASNIAAIKRSMPNQEWPVVKFLRLADEEEYIDNKEKAKEYLLRARYYTEQNSNNNVLINDTWVPKEKAIKMIDRRIARIDGSELLSGFEEGTLVAHINTGQQMRIGEFLPDGKYRCYSNGMRVGDFSEEEFMEFDKWVKEVYKQPTR